MLLKIKTKLLIIVILFFVLWGLKLIISEPEIKNEINFSLYFSNSKLDPNLLDCSRVFAVERSAFLPNDSDKYLLVVNSLIEGLKQSEITAGYFSSINSNAKVNSISFNEGVLLVDFSEELENNAAGSCRVGAIRSQIDSTLKQFEEVEGVRILVAGRETDILQP